MNTETFRILMYIRNNAVPGRTFTHEYLMEHVAGLNELIKVDSVTHIPYNRCLHDKYRTAMKTVLKVLKNEINIAAYKKPIFDENDEIVRMERGYKILDVQESFDQTKKHIIKSMVQTQKAFLSADTIPNQSNRTAHGRRTNLRKKDALTHIGYARLNTFAALNHLEEIHQEQVEDDNNCSVVRSAGAKLVV